MASSKQESQFLRAFREGYEEANRAWDDGDFKRAYGGLPKDFDYRPLESWPHARRMRGPAEIVPFFEDFRESFPDAHSELLEFVEADNRTVIVGFKVMGTGERSGVGTTMEIWQVWELNEEGIPIRVREFSDRAAALEAAGAAEGE